MRRDRIFHSILPVLCLLAVGCKKQVEKGTSVRELVTDSILIKHLPFPFEVQNVPFQTLGPDHSDILITSNDDIGYELVDLKSSQTIRMDSVRFTGRSPMVLLNGNIYKIKGREFAIQVHNLKTDSMRMIGLKTIFDRYPDRWLSEKVTLVGNRYLVLQVYGPPKTQEEVVKTWGTDPVVFIHDLQTNTSTEVKVPMPDREIARTSQYNYMQSVAVNSSGALLYFMHTDSAYVLRPAKGTLERIRLQADRFERQEAFRIDSAWSNDYQVAQQSTSSRTFIAMQDPYRKMTYVTVYHSCQNNCYAGEDRAEILVYDSLFHYRGAVAIPQNHYWTCCQFVGPKGLYLSKSIKGSRYEKVFAFDCIDAARAADTVGTGLPTKL